MNDDGATKTSDENLQKPECMGRYKHYWNWVWSNDEITEQQTCSTCGEVRTIPNVREVL
jgi:hypothetical protein